MSTLAPRIPRAFGWLGALLLALGVNLAVFCAAPWMINKETPDLEPVDYPLVAYMTPHPPPPPRELKETPPPKPPPVLKLKKLAAPSPVKPKVNLRAPELDLEASPSIGSGPPLAALPPLAAKPSTGIMDRDPMVAARVPPIYPYFARRRGIEGWVKVRFLVDETGQVERTEIVKAEPSGVFEQAVKRSVSRWRFRPGLRDGKPARAWIETTIRFKLE